MNTRTLCIFALALSLLSTTGWAEEPSNPHLARLPGRVLGALTIPDISAWSARFEHTIKRQLGSAGEPFIESLTARRSEVSKHLQEELGVTLDEWDQLGLGRITVASVKIEAEPVAVVALIDYESEPLIKQLVDRVTLAMDRTGFSRKEVKLHETPSVVFRRPDPEREFAICQRDHVLCVGTSADVMRAVMRGWQQPGTDPIEHYDVITKHCRTTKREPLLTWFVNPMGFATEFMLHEGAADLEFQQFVRGLFPEFGLDGLKAIGGTIDIGDEDIAAVARVQLVLDKKLTGILSVLSLQSGDLHPPAWVPDSTVSYRALRWNIQAFHDGWDKLLAIFEGQGALEAYLDRLATIGGGVHIKRAVLNRLTGQFSISRFEHNGRDHTVVGIQVRDVEHAAESLEESTRVRFDWASRPSKAARAGAQTYYQIRFGETDVFVMLVGDTLRISTEESAIRVEHQRSLRDAPEFKRVAAYFADRCVLQMYDPTTAVVETPYEFLRTGTTPEDTMGIDFSALPPYAAIRSRLGPTATCAVENDAGVLVTHFNLYGESAKEHE